MSKPPRVSERKRLAEVGKAQTKSEPGAARGSYPTNTPGRAVAAKAYATQAVNAGRMSPATERGIDARANRELGKSGTARELTKRVAARNDRKK
jgi:hypothetical protein